MKLTWHGQGSIDDFDKLDGVSSKDLMYLDVLIVDHDTGIVYQGRADEGTFYLAKEVEAFLAS